MTPERSNPLHNFHLPQRLTWGTLRHLRCKKSDDHRSDLAPISDGIEAIGEKLMMDFKHRIDNMKVIGTTDDDIKTEEKASRPWNLRVRRSPAPSVGVVAVESRIKKVVIRERYSPLKRVRGVSEEEKVVNKLRVALEREEIEEDFLAIGGIKLPRRPKKRPRAIQKELDTLFPGLGLTEVTLEKYAVREAPES